MLTGLKRWTAVGTTISVAVIFAAACGQIIPASSSDRDLVPQAGPTTEAVPVATTATRRAPGAQPVAVKRDSIIETLALEGLVAPADQTPVSSVGRGTILDVNVKVGQSVKQGDVLLDFDPGDLPKTLEAARLRLQTDQANMAQTQAQADAAAAVAARKAEADAQLQQQAVLDAQVALQRAQENLVSVKAGRSATDRQIAATSVSYYGETTVRAAQDALDKVLAGPDADTIRAATREVANAQATLAKAQSDLVTLTKGPDANAVRSAQNGLLRAQTQLQLVQASKPDSKIDPTLAKLQREAALQDAQVAAQNAEDALTKLKQPPAEAVVEAAQQKVQDTQDAVDSAQNKLDTLQAGPDPTAVAGAQRNLEYAKHTLAEMQKGLDEVNSHPTPLERQAAEDQVRKAQEALTNATQRVIPTDGGRADVSPAQQAINLDQTDIAAAEQAIEKTHVRAPFDGTVASVKTRPGSTTTAYQTLVVMAKPGPAIVHVDLVDDQDSRLTVGQQAMLQFDVGTPAAPAATIAATISVVSPAAADGTKPASADLRVNWPDGPVYKFGTPVQIALQLQQKQDVLVIPTSALHQSGTKATVEVLNGTLRRLVTVEVGIKTPSSAEILSGLAEGQLVLVAAATPGTP